MQAFNPSPIDGLDSATQARVLLWQSGRPVHAPVLSVGLQPLSAKLTAFAASGDTTGLLAQTAANTFSWRTLAAPAAGFTITNPAGVAGNPTFVLANDLAALEGLGSTGIAARSATDTWVQRTITGTANKITVNDGNGVSGNPTITIPDAVTLVTPTVSGTLDVNGLFKGKGTATNDSADAGDIGEVISSTVLVASAVSLTTAVAANVTSISLTAGDWDVRGDVSWATAATTSVTRLVCSISTTSATLDQVGAGTATGLQIPATVPGAGNNFWKLPVGPTRISLSATTTVYLVTVGVFTVSTLTAYGSIVARRVR